MDALRKPRLAFTIIELFVVIGIMTLLLGLILPAIQRVRETANKFVCANNLKQIGVAIHHHELDYGYFPDGGEAWWSPRSQTNGYPFVSPRQDWSWMYQILPYIEKDGVWTAMDDDGIRRHIVIAFICPTRRGPMLIDGRAIGDYAGNGGGNPWEETTGCIIRKGRTASIRMSASIPDGASNTLLAGEKRLNMAELGEPQFCDNDGWTGGWDWDNIRWGCISPERDRYEPGYLGGDVKFGSSHPTSFNSLFADGSVRPVRYLVDMYVWHYVCGRSDGIRYDPAELD